MAKPKAKPKQTTAKRKPPPHKPLASKPRPVLEPPVAPAAPLGDTHMPAANSSASTDPGPELLASVDSNQLKGLRGRIRHLTVADLPDIAAAIGMLLDRELRHPERMKRDEEAAKKAEADEKAAAEKAAKDAADKAKADADAAAAAASPPPTAGGKPSGSGKTGVTANP